MVLVTSMLLEFRGIFVTNWNIYAEDSISVCFNKSLTECSVLSMEFQQGMSNPRSASGHSFNMLFCL